MIPSSLNSLLEWLSFNIHPLDGKLTMIVELFYDIQGSSRAQSSSSSDFWMLLGRCNSCQVVSFYGRAYRAFDDNGDLIDERTTFPR